MYHQVPSKFLTGLLHNSELLTTDWNQILTPLTPRIYNKIIGPKYPIQPEHRKSQTRALTNLLYQSKYKDTYRLPVQRHMVAAKVYEQNCHMILTRR